MLAGLHFAGETGANTDEHALACLLESVLEKLEITLLPPTQKLSPRPPKISRKGINFTKDTRIPAEFQCGDELYSGNRLDRGHVARRADLLWGSRAGAGITPQIEDFNQSSQNGAWGRIEDAVFSDVEVDDLKVSVFGGPVFREDDRLYRHIPLPREYWKDLAFTDHGELQCRAFLLTVSEVQERTGLWFPDAVPTADTFTAPESRETRKPLDTRQHPLVTPALQTRPGKVGRSSCTQ